jgi:hypothetical protein
MNIWKKNISALAVGIAIASPATYAEFELAPGLTMTGFMDMSASYVEYDPAGGDSSSESSSGLDQFEINLMYDFGKGLSAVVDLEYQDNGAVDSNGEPVGEETHVEQAYINYAIDDNWSLKAGRFLSYSGWETEDPTGLFQYSGTGYAKYFYGAYQQGASVKYGSDMFDAALSVVNDLGTLTGDTRDTSNPATEIMLAVRPLDGLTAKAFIMNDTNEDNGEDIESINVWASYVVAGWTFAAEANASENSYAAVGIAGAEAEAEGYLLMANYAWDKFGVTLRYHGSEVETEAGVTVEDITGITLAPSYQVHENLLLIFEVRTDEEDVSGDEYESVAFEALLTF